MKYKFQKLRYCIINMVFEQLLLLLIILTIIFLWLFLNSWIELPAGKEVESILGIVIIYTGVIFNVVTYKIARDQFFKSLFIEFNSRFDQMNDSLNEIRENKLTKKKKKKRIILDYLNLCAEEYLWFTKGRIEPIVWQSWENGMRFYLLNENFSKIVEKQKEEKSSYYNLFDMLK